MQQRVEAEGRNKLHEQKRNCNLKDSDPDQQENRRHKSGQKDEHGQQGHSEPI